MPPITAKVAEYYIHVNGLLDIGTRKDVLVSNPSRQVAYGHISRQLSMAKGFWDGALYAG